MNLRIGKIKRTDERKPCFKQDEIKGVEWDLYPRIRFRQSGMHHSSELISQLTKLSRHSTPGYRLLYAITTRLVDVKLRVVHRFGFQVLWNQY